MIPPVPAAWAQHLDAEVRSDYFTDLSAFVNVTMTGSGRDATPAAGSPLLGAASGTHAVTDDLNKNDRTAPHDSGAVGSSP